MSNQQFLRLGVLTRTFGIDGGLRLALDAEVMPGIETPCQVRLGYSESYTRMLELTRSHNHSGTLVCYFQGVNSPDDATALIDQALFVPEERLTYPDPLSHPGLIGFRVESETGEYLGKITGISTTAAHHIWTVERDGYEWMIPAIDQFLIKLNREEQQAIVHLIPGLFTPEPDDEE